MDIRELAVDFVKLLFHVYLEERDFIKFSAMLDKNISWIGTGAHEICRNRSEADRLITAEKESWDGKFTINSEQYDAVPINDQYCVVYGELKIQEEGYSLILLDMHSRFSMLCRKDEDGFKLVHAHFSVPNVGQQEGEFVHKAIVHDYNILLEKTLEERTKLLKDKTKELEVMMTNIRGGVQICKDNPEYTILYANEGFYKLVGYTAEDIQERYQNSHARLLDDMGYSIVGKQIAEQTKDGSDSFTVEYSIIRKDGVKVWVLDKGRLIENGGERQVQSILTDITGQKELEEELSVKNRELQMISDNVDFGIIESSLEDGNKVEFINPTVLKILGYTKEQYDSELGNAFDCFAMECDAQTARKNVEILKETGGPYSFQTKAWRRDGKVISLQGNAVALTAQNGKRVGIFTLRDITEEEYNKELILKKNEELMIIEKRYEIAMQHSDADIFDYIIADKQILFSELMSQRYGVPRVLDNAVEELVSRGVIHPSNVERYVEAFRKIDAGEPVVDITVLATDMKGNKVLNEIYLTNIFDEEGNPLRAVGVMNDITELNLLEKEKQYSEAMASGKLMSFEVNVTQDTVDTWDENWREAVGIPCGITVYSKMIAYMRENRVHLDYVDEFSKFFDKASIMKAWSEGKTQVVMQYPRKEFDEDYIWVQSTMNIIRDEITKDIKVRCYINNINEQKAKELKVQEEQRFYDAMVSKSAVVYEVNLTKDTFISGHDTWFKLFGIPKMDSYSMMIDAFMKKAIFEDDLESFEKVFLRENVLEAFFSGTQELYCEYRRPDENGVFIWVSCNMHLLEDLLTNEVKGFCYVQDIDKEKRRQLDLIYKAEHDALTGLFNKGVTEQKINEFLLTSDGKQGKHAFFILDIDYFKNINDNLGHSFGDAVLSQVAHKIKDLFREDDVLGRIGGDEFVVFMKNIAGYKSVQSKAKEMCAAIKETYSKNDLKLQVSVSIGIAYYPKSGNCYEDLYNHSDTALYLAKENGRDQFAVFNGNMRVKAPILRGFDENEFVQAKSFEKNVSEYVFQILYESADKISAINSVLELVGKHYNVSRAYIFEDDADGLSISNTFEWCDSGIFPQKDELQMVLYSNLDNYSNKFNDMGIYYLSDIEFASKSVKSILEPQNIKSMLQFAIIKNDKFSGFVGFDYCGQAREPDKEEITDLKNIANILGVFLTEMRSITTIENTKNVALSIVDGLDAYAYVIDSDTYKLLFINKSTKTLTPKVQVGEYCFQVFWNRQEPCERCPMNGLINSKGERCSMEIFNHNFGCWLKSTASWITWTDGKVACLMDNVDITSYRK